MVDMTWGDFKRKVKEGGVQDEDVVVYIDWCGGLEGVVNVKVGRLPDDKSIWIGDF